MEQPHILHVDLDAFFASAERVLSPELKNKPVIVGSAQENRGVVASASYDARSKGVKAGMPIYQSRRLCPEAAYRPGNYSEYKRLSQEVFAILWELTPKVEPVSLDEAYLDVSGCERLHGSRGAGPLGRLPFAIISGGTYVRQETDALPPPKRTLVPRHHRWISALAMTIKQTVRTRTDLTVSVGCATNKLAAKSASDFCKPDGLALITPGTEEQFFLTLPLGEIPGIGRATREKFHKWNAHTVAEARHLPRSLLKTAFGDRGCSIHAALRGQGETELTLPEHPRSLSRERTFWTPSNDRNFVESMLFYLTERLGKTLRKKQLVGRTVHVKLRYNDFTTVERSRSLKTPADLDEEIFPVASHLMDRRWDQRRRLRLVGVKVSDLRPNCQRQQKLFDDKLERQRRIDRCVDELRDKFGFNVVQKGLSIALNSRLERDDKGFQLRTPALSQ
ncbi:MAG: DNA polymerase IV [Planctomycetes bacterium]|nr:DNA polymerase IV [Planctomycetota bacterium]